MEEACTYEECPLRKRYLAGSDTIGFFTAIQNEQVDLVRHCLEVHPSTCSVDAVDEFGWTAQRTAEQTGDAELINLFNEFTNARQNASTSETTTLEGNIPEEVAPIAQFCKICSTQVQCIQTHRLTISHRLKISRQEQRPHFWIRRSSVGYRLLLKDGWDDSHGIRQDSQLYPVQSVMKADKLAGIGIKNDIERRITHFRPGKVQRIQTPTKKASARRRSTGSSGLTGLSQRNLRRMIADY